MIKSFLEEAGQNVWLTPFLLVFIVLLGALYALAGYNPKQTPFV